ncbi:Tim17-domain-containing protein [Fistulina hepatica ATCC 64428]|uniref:Mitochondrial import inner membrane translocase subunit TIM22 n=1 Tax=Fistulina hepatica ATCC 64428 TaxID=1128425 RepID=A0A0D7A4T3_9AGAR|nr:Tim17-domain-containing protein [Fistulina hepatica ATCC 64428]
MEPDRRLALRIPYHPPGQEPLPPGMTEEDRQAMMLQEKYQRLMTSFMTENCATKAVLAGGMGFGIGAFFSLLSTSLAYEDPIMRGLGQNAAAVANKSVKDYFKDMGRGMYSSGKGFAKVGALFSGIECCIEGYRAKNDIYNSLASGFLAGGVLARNAGPRAALAGGAAFALFSGAIDLFFLRREPPDDD